jgi:hypothetical protein
MKFSCGFRGAKSLSRAADLVPLKIPHERVLRWRVRHRLVHRMGETKLLRAAVVSPTSPSIRVILMPVRYLQELED